MNGQVQCHTVQILVDDVTNYSCFDFGEGATAGENIRARVIASANGVPEEVVVTVTVNAWAYGAEYVLVRRSGLAPETGLLIK